MTGTSPISVYVSPSGNDTNGGTSWSDAMATPQAAVNSVPQGGEASIYLLAGSVALPNTYLPANFYYRCNFNVAGVNSDLSAGDPRATVIQAQSAGQTAVESQDHVIVGLTDLTINAVASGCVAISGRQHSITDIVNCRLGAFPSGVQIGMADFAIASASGSLWIDGAAQTLVSLNTAKFNLGATVYMAGGLTYGAQLLSIVGLSKLDASAAVITGAGGGTSTVGTQWYLENSVLNLPTGGYIIPGNVAGNGTLVGTTAGGRVWAN